MKPIEKWAGVLALPAIIYFLIFTVYPIIGNVILSFQKETFTGALVWAGWYNYHTILWIHFLAWFLKTQYFIWLQCHL